MSKWRKHSHSLLNFTQQAFLNGDEFLSRLQIRFHECVNIHKWALKSQNVHDSDFKQGWKGIRVKTKKRAARWGRHATVNLLSYIKCIHCYDFSTELQKKNPHSCFQCNQHPCLFCLWGVSVPRLWSFLCLCCEPAQPRGEVTFSVNHRYRKLILSSTEHTDTHSLTIDWNPARSGSLTVRQHQSWYSPAMKENPSAEVGSKERNPARAQGNWQIPSWQGSWSSTVDTPTWHLSLWHSRFSLSLSDGFSFLNTHQQLTGFLIHTPLLCVSQQCASKVFILCGFLSLYWGKLVLIKSWWHCLTVWLLHY